MLSTRFSVRHAVMAALMSMAAVVLSACANTGQQSSSIGTGVDPNAPVRVALLVPDGTGDPGRDLIARSLINAAQLAKTDLRNATIDLAIYPTGGTTEGGYAAAQQAIAEGAAVIVGPLFSTATSGAESAVNGTGVNILSMSNNPAVASNNVYILGNTFENTADQLVAYGLAHGLQNYGVVYPSGLEGETARDAVASAVFGRGGNLVVSEPYDLSVEGIQAAAGPAAAAISARGANAVILTDGPTGGLGFISEALRNNGVSPAQAQFLGIQRWDTSAEILAQGSLQGSVFAAPDRGRVQQFDGRYQNTFGERPHELASLAYDGIAAVGALIAGARADGSDPFTDAKITQSSGFAGVNGAFRFFPNGTNQRNLAIYEVRGGQAVVVQRAAGSFGGLSN